jgi:hypothetical protein
MENPQEGIHSRLHTYVKKKCRLVNEQLYKDVCDDRASKIIYFSPREHQSIFFDGIFKVCMTRNIHVTL